MVVPNRLPFNQCLLRSCCVLSCKGTNFPHQLPNTHLGEHFLGIFDHYTANFVITTLFLQYMKDETRIQLVLS